VQPAPRRDAVGLVLEFARIEGVELRKEVLLQQLRVQGGHAVDGVRGDDGEVGHADLLVAVLLDQGADALLVVVAGPFRLHRLHEDGVDVVDELEMARQHALEQAHAPLLEGLGQERVVGVGEGGPRDFQRSVQRHFFLVNEDARELDDGDGGVRVVELHGDLVREVLPVVGRVAVVAADDVAQRAGDEEILLHEAQLLAVLGLVVRIKHLRDGLADGLLAHGLHVAAAVEGGEVEVLGGFRGPEAEQVDGAGAEARRRDVVRHAEDGLGADPARAIVAAVVEHVLDAAVELHRLGVFRAGHFPGIAEEHPVVGMLDLVALFKGLPEKAELVVDAVAERRVVLRRQRIEKARREAAEAAVAQPHVHLGLADLLKVLAERLQRRFRRVHEAGGEQVVAEEPAHEVFEGEIVDAADVVEVVHRLGGDHPLVDGVAHREGRGHPPVPRRGRALVPGERRDEMPLDQRAEDGLGAVRLRSFRALGGLGGGFGGHGKGVNHKPCQRGRQGGILPAPGAGLRAYPITYSRQPGFL
jgi:hypothetical protein